MCTSKRSVQYYYVFLFNAICTNYAFLTFFKLLHEVLSNPYTCNYHLLTHTQTYALAHTHTHKHIHWHTHTHTNICAGTHTHTQADNEFFTSKGENKYGYVAYFAVLVIWEIIPTYMIVIFFRVRMPSASSVSTVHSNSLFLLIRISGTVRVIIDLMRACRIAVNCIEICHVLI